LAWWGRSDEAPHGTGRLDLKDLIAKAPSVPLTGQVRVGRKRLIEHLESEIDWSDGTERADQAAAALRTLVDSAKPIPLTDDVRFDPTEALALLAKLRGDVS
jgi:hypothetical protein